MAQQTITGLQNIQNYLAQNPSAQYQITSGGDQIAGLLGSGTPYNFMGNRAGTQQQGGGGLDIGGSIMKGLMTPINLGLGLLTNPVETGAGIINGIADPFVRLGRVGEVAMNDLIGQGDYARGLEKKYWGEDANLAQEGLRGALGVGSWLLPGIGAPGGLMNAVSRGAFAGAGGALSQQDFLNENIDFNRILEGAFSGASAGGSMYGAGKALGSVKNKLFGGEKSPTMQPAEMINPSKRVEEYITNKANKMLSEGMPEEQVYARLGISGSGGNAKLNAIQEMYNTRQLTGNEVGQALDDLVNTVGDDPAAAQIIQNAQKFKTSIPDADLRMITSGDPSARFKLGTMKDQKSSFINQGEEIFAKQKIIESIEHPDILNDPYSKGLIEKYGLTQEGVLREAGLDPAKYLNNNKMPQAQIGVVNPGKVLNTDSGFFEELADGSRRPVVWADGTYTTLDQWDNYLGNGKGQTLDQFLGTGNKTPMIGTSDLNSQGMVDLADDGILDPRLKEIAGGAKNAKDFAKQITQKNPLDYSNYDYRFGRALGKAQGSLAELGPEDMSSLQATYPDAAKALGSTKDTIVVYRAVPEGVDGRINTGDYITPAKSYAQEHLDTILDGKGKIIKETVSKSDVLYGGPQGDFQEFVYSPSDFRSQYRDASSLYEAAKGGGSSIANDLAGMTEAQIRKNQDLVASQIETAYKQGNTTALTKLQKASDEYMNEMMRRTEGVGAGATELRPDSGGLIKLGKYNTRAELEKAGLYFPKGAAAESAYVDGNRYNIFKDKKGYTVTGGKPGTPQDAFFEGSSELMPEDLGRFRNTPASEIPAEDLRNIMQGKERLPSLGGLPSSTEAAQKELSKVLGDIQKFDEIRYATSGQPDLGNTMDAYMGKVNVRPQETLNPAQAAQYEQLSNRAMELESIINGEPIATDVAGMVNQVKQKFPVPEQPNSTYTTPTNPRTGKLQVMTDPELDTVYRSLEKQQLGAINQTDAMRGQIKQIGKQPLPENLRSVSDDPYQIFVKKETPRVDVDKLNALEKNAIIKDYQDIGIVPKSVKQGGSLDFKGSYKKTINTLETLIRQEGLDKMSRADAVSQLANKLSESRDYAVQVAQGRVIIDNPAFQDSAARAAKGLMGGHMDDAQAAVTSEFYNLFPDKMTSPDPFNPGGFKELGQLSTADLYDITQNPEIKDVAYKVMYGKGSAAVRPEAAAKTALFKTANNLLKEKVPGYQQANEGFRVLFEQNPTLVKAFTKGGSIKDLMKQNNKFQVLGTDVPAFVVNAADRVVTGGAEKLGRGLSTLGRLGEKIRENPIAGPVIDAASYVTPGFVSSQAGKPGLSGVGNVLGSTTVSAATDPSMMGLGGIPTSGNPTQMGIPNQMSQVPQTTGGTSQMGGGAPSISGISQSSTGGIPQGQMSGGQEMPGIGMSPGLTRNKLFAAILGAMGGSIENIPRAMQLTEFLGPELGVGGEGSLGTAERAQLSRLDQASNLLNQVGQQVSQLGLSQSGIGAKLGGGLRKIGASSLGLGKDVGWYEDLRDGLALQFASYLAPRGTAPSGPAIELVSKYIPSITDTEYEASQKLMFLNQMIENNKQSVLAAPYAGQGGYDPAMMGEDVLAGAYY